MAKKPSEELVVGKKASAKTKEVKQPTKAKTPVKAVKPAKQPAKQEKPVNVKAPLVVPAALEPSKDKLPWDDAGQSGKVKMSAVLAIGGTNTPQTQVLPTFKTK